MKPVTKLAALLLLSVPFLFAACVKDNCDRIVTYTYFVPEYKTKAEVRANIKSNPARDIVNPGKLYIRGSYIFLNEIDKGIHVIDNSNPSNPQNIAFIDIPGNMDIAVKGNTLYADFYTDLVTLDISNPSSVIVKKISDNIFPYRFYGGGFNNTGNQDKIIVDWKTSDTTIKSSCSEMTTFAMGGDVFLANVNMGGAGLGSTASTPFGQGGSMARFAILNDRLYTVGVMDLDVFNISTPYNPVRTNTVSINWDIETIFPFGNKLFIGSMSGMYIYDVSNPDAPIQSGVFNHVRVCDPVIADAQYAYVTLRSGTICAGFTNQLDIVNLNNFNNPTLLKTYQMSNPHGLSKDGNYLFVCDEGLKIFDASDANNLVLKKHFTGMETYDVIAYGNKALVVAKDGLYQYDYSDIQQVRLLSKILVKKD